MENAIKYSGKVSLIRVAVRSSSLGQPQLSVTDNGPGVPESEHQHILQRFVRLDKNRSTPGNGLGLSLVDATCSLHHATLTLRDNQPGLRVEIVFPAPQA